MVTDIGERDLTWLFEPYCAGRRVTVRVSPSMYPLQTDAEANWVWHAFRGFAIASRVSSRHNRRPVTSFASIGTGGGLDAIGAALIFRDLQRLAITDINRDVLDVSVWNVKRNVGPNIATTGLVGDLCDPLAAAGTTWDVIYANLPNVPALPDVPGGTNRASFYPAGSVREAPSELGTYLLNLQYHFLLSARQALAPQGAALLMLGGRFPHSILTLLARATSYEFDELLTALKLQTETAATLTGYARRELGIEFAFYLYDPARAALESAGELDGAALREEIRPYRLSAREALDAYGRGRRVGHTLHMLMARPIPLGSEPRGDAKPDGTSIDCS